MKKQVMYALMASGCLLAASCKKSAVPGAAQANSPSGIKKNFVAGEMTGVLPNGVYRFVPEAGDGLTPQKAIGVKDSSSLNEKLVESRDFAHNKGQEWRITSLGSGQYTMVNVNSGRALDVPWGNLSEGEQMWQYTLSNPIGTAQKWIIEPQGTFPVYRIKSAINSTYGLHVATTTNGAMVTTELYSKKPQAQGYFRVYRVAYKDKAATGFFRRTSGWTVGDGCSSIPLADGANPKVLWVMDDSGINSYNPADGTTYCFPNVRNCGIVQPAANNWSLTAATTYPGANAYGLFRPTTGPNNDNYSWPSHGFYLNGIAYVWCPNQAPVAGQVYPASAPPHKFGKFQASTNTVVGYQTLQSFYSSTLDATDGATPEGNGEIAFGKGFVKTASYVYAYGAYRVDADNGWNQNVDVYVARFPATTAGVAAAWEFWNGSAWVTNINTIGQSASVGVADNGAFHMTMYGSKYIMICSQLSLGCDADNTTGGNIFVNSSSSPTGPFPIAARKSVYRVDDRYYGQMPWFYSAHGHTEHTVNNEFLITYNLNDHESCANTCISVGKTNADRCRPKAIRVPLKLIDPAL